MPHLSAETQRIFWRYLAAFGTAIGVLVSLYQMHEFGYLRLAYVIPFTVGLALLGATLATVFISTLRKADATLQPYQPRGEPELAGVVRFVFHGEDLCLASPHLPDRAATRLRDNIVEVPFLGEFRVDAVVGRIHGDQVKLRWAPSGIGWTARGYPVRAIGVTGFNPIFVGRFRPVGTGSVLEGVYRLPVWATAFVCLWFGALTVMTLVAVLLPFALSGWGAVTVSVGLTIGIFLLAAGAIGAGTVGAVAFGRRISRASLAQLSDVIHRSLA